MLQAVVANALSWRVGPVEVVLGAHEEEVLEELDLGGADVVVDLEWEDGEGSSLRVGLDALLRGHSKVRAALIVPVDAPDIEPEVISQLVEAYLASGSQALLPRYRYAPGPPALIDAALWPWLMNREGDIDIVELLRAHPAWVEEVRTDRRPPSRLGVRS